MAAKPKPIPSRPVVAFANLGEPRKAHGCALCDEGDAYANEGGRLVVFDADRPLVLGEALPICLGCGLSLAPEVAGPLVLEKALALAKQDPERNAALRQALAVGGTP
jgi:hypothetical protein